MKIQDTYVTPRRYDKHQHERYDEKGTENND